MDFYVWFLTKNFEKEIAVQSLKLIQFKLY